MSDNKFYLTTPIYYVNARPHIGHAYTTIVADVLARRHRLLGDDTFFLTGTDEHGQKIERSAAAAGIPPQQFADQVSRSFEDLWARMGITNNRYIRTTDPKHQRGVQHLFSELYARGFIYLASYTGSYCVSDEAFVDAPVGTPCPDCGRLLEEVTEENFFFKLSEFQKPLIELIDSQQLVIENDARRNEVLSFLTGNVQTFVRDNAALLPSISGNPLALTDAVGLAVDKGLLQSTNSRRIYVPGALKDLSISRSSFTWGIPVPEPAASAAAQKHVIYVWLDALANYMTAIGYGSDDPADQAEFKKYWPADLHLVGKEIIRFHCVYWPAFLLAAGLPLPKAITAHGWLLFDNSKMSKSKGNIVRTETILDAFGTLCPPIFTGSSSLSGISSGLQPTESGSPDKRALAPDFSTPPKHDRDLFASDVLRYFLLREIPFGQDGSFSFEALITRYNADLANGYGNLVSRTLNMISQYFDGIVPTPLDHEHEATEQILAGVVAHQCNPNNAHDFAGLIEAVWGMFASTDAYITRLAPWKLAKDPTKRQELATVLYNCAEFVRCYTALSYEYLPFATANVWRQLGLGDIETAAASGQLTNLQWGGLKPGTKLGPLSPIFPRADKSLIETMTTMEEQNQLAAQSSSLKADTPTPAEPAPGHTPHSEAPLKSATTPATFTPTATTTWDPAAPPRSFEDAASLPVGGSLSDVANLPTNPGSFTEAPASGLLATTAAQTPITNTPTDASPQISIDDFIKVELRIAQILVAERIPKADKLLRLEVDLGDFGKRQILSGIAEHYPPEDLIGRRIIVITNLAPRKMRGLESHGMLLAASEENGKPYLATVPEGVPLGTRLK